MIENIHKKLEDWYIELVFLIGAAGTAGSLYTSQVLEWQVCGICWVQRVFMYPVPLIAATAIMTEKKNTVLGVLPLTVLGAVFSGYHYFSIAFDPTQGCGFILPCSLTNRLYVGLSLMPRTLPLLAFIAFSITTLVIWRYGYSEA